MAFWYEGNKNLAENKRELGGVEYYVRGLREVEGIRFERYGIKTHFITVGEDLVENINKYVIPLYKQGDILMLGEKVVSMCQGNTVKIEDVKLGFFAKFLSKFATTNNNGIGMNEPYKLQLAINMKGLPLILWATFCAGVGKIFGKRGVFYEIVGQDVAGIDGFYEHSAFDTYHSLAVLNPENPNEVCENIKSKLGISCMCVDANDISVEILGKSSDLADKTDEFLAELIRDNPAGQDDELTPFILIRDIGDSEAEEFVDVKPIEEPNH